MSAEVNLSGYVDVGSASGGISVNGGSVTNSSFSIQHLAAHGHITYTIARGQGSAENGDPPVFRVPLGVDYTIPGEVPIYLKLQTAVLLKLGVSSKNAVIRGGADFTTDGTDSVTESGKKVSESSSGETVSGGILDQQNGGVGGSISLAPSGTVVAVQFPKLGVGLGFTSANAIAYIDAISSIGQTTGGALGGMFCSAYDLFFSVGAGLEAQVGLGKLGLSLATPRKIIWPTNGEQKHVHVAEPGC